MEEHLDTFIRRICRCKRHCAPLIKNSTRFIAVWGCEDRLEILKRSSEIKRHYNLKSIRIERLLSPLSFAFIVAAWSYGVRT